MSHKHRPFQLNSKPFPISPADSPLPEGIDLSQCETTTVDIEDSENDTVEFVHPADAGHALPSVPAHTHTPPVYVDFKERQKEAIRSRYLKGEDDTSSGPAHQHESEPDRSQMARYLGKRYDGALLYSWQGHNHTAQEMLSKHPTVTLEPRRRPPGLHNG